MAGAASSELSRGGMQTKIEAARIATDAGTHMVIASGLVDHPLRAIAAGARCTWFLTAANPVTARKKWIAGALEPKGTLVIDAGAVAALRRGKSLLPAGVTAVEGGFARGDAVIIRGPDGVEIGRGLCAYDVEDAAKNQRPVVRGHRPNSGLQRPDGNDPSGRSGGRLRYAGKSPSIPAKSREPRPLGGRGSTPGD